MNPRRDFLSMVGASALALTLRHTIVRGGESKSASLALLSDTHIHKDPLNEYRGFRPAENLAKVVSQVAESKTDIALLCGDAARLDGQIDDYQHLKTLIEPIRAKMPMDIALGNHDDRANFWKVFGSPKDTAALKGKKHVSVVDAGPQRWIVLDSLMFVDKTPGFLGQEQRDWLDQQLAGDASKPVVIMVHHTLGEHDGDLLDTERLLTIIKKHPQVKAVVFGHSHQWKIVQTDGVWFINLPAIGYNFADEQPLGWVRADLESNQIKLTLSTVAGNVSLNQTTRILAWS